MSIFGALEVYHDAARPAAMNMAIDEALLEMANIPAIRFYRWHSPALSFGYFGRFADVVDYAAQRDLVRRWTGGGIVLHGDDLTYSVIIPARDSLFVHSSISIYTSVHSAIRNALVASGERAQMAPNESPRVSESCFANPVRADVMVNGRKVAGAAQRRTRAGLLHQGSIQQVDLGKHFTERFAQELSGKWTARNLDQTIFNRAQEIGEQKYANQAWLRRR